MLIAIAPAAFALLGALIYAFAVNPKLAEIGRIAFACGMLWLVWALSGHTFRIG